ncbi:MAG: response regulator [Acidisphaera sp.]|nr:response regulator [Acidisphaera sp.]
METFTSRRLPSLRSLLAATFGLVALVGASGAALLAGRDAASRLQAASGAELANLAQQLASVLDQSLFERWRDVRMAAGLDSMRDPIADTDTRRRVLDEMQATSSQYGRVAFIGPQGRVLADSRRRLEGQDLSRSDIFRTGRDRPAVADGHGQALAAADGPVAINLAAPVRQDDGRLIGVLLAELHRDWAAGVEHGFASLAGRLQGAASLVVAGDDTVLLGPPSLVGRKLPAALRALGSRPQRWPDGRAYLVGQAPTRGYLDFPGLDWTVMVRQDATAALAPAAQARRRATLWGLVGAIAAALLGSAIAGAIARPQAALAAAAARLPEGGEAVQSLAGHARAAWYQEAATLAASLAGLVARLRSLNETLEERVAIRTVELEETQRALSTAQRMEALGRLTGGIAHDFNNLLQIMTSGLALLDRSEDPARRRALQHAMHQAIERGGRLTQQLLAFARRQPLAPEPLDLRRRVEGIRSLLEQALGPETVLRIDLPTRLWWVLADATQLEVALLNLAANAHDAMPAGGALTITAANEALAEELGSSAPLVGDFVRLCVADTGGGMAPDVLARACEPFFTTKSGRGTGLGLSQVYGFAHQSGGTVRIESELEVGTTVGLLLPRASVPVADGEEPHPAVAALGCERPLGILLAEDNDDLAALLIDLLGQLGHKVERVHSAPAALDVMLRRTDFDLLFTDVVMPGGMSGVALAREVRKLLPSLPIVLTTGYSDMLGEVLATGLPVLRKPYQLADLKAVLPVGATQRPARDNARAWPIATSPIIAR